LNFCSIFIISGKYILVPRFHGDRLRENGAKSNKIKKTERKTYVKSFGINILKESVILEITLPFVFVIITLKIKNQEKKTINFIL